MATVWFDSYLKCKNGKLKPYYDCSFHVDDLYDQKLVWFHEGYGLMRLYRVHRVEGAEKDEEDANYIAEKVGPSCFTGDDRWKEVACDPEKCLEEYLQKEA